MTPELAAFAERELAMPVPPEVRAFAEALGGEQAARAVLFYGSVLRTGDLEGLLDFYVLTAAPHRGGWRAWLEQRLWPEVSYRELEIGGRMLRAKVATMTLSAFQRAARDETLDTTIWTRFVQPAALAYAADPAATRELAEAVGAAAVTAGAYAAALGPPSGSAEDYWLALFSRTYATEFRVEKPGREREILGYHAARYRELLPLAWRGAGLPFEQIDGRLQPAMAPDARRRLLKAWRRHVQAGKPLNIARLAKAAFTFEGAARYAAWKIQRHAGVTIEVTPWRERHPVLAAPGVAWRLWRARRRGPGAARRPR